MENIDLMRGIFECLSMYICICQNVYASKQNKANQWKINKTVCKSRGKGDQRWGKYGQKMTTTTNKKQSKVYTTSDFVLMIMI